MLTIVLTYFYYHPSLIKHPGQTKFGQEIRNLILNGTQPKADIAHRLLFWADYAETMKCYENEDLLILDRHPYSSDYAYGYGLSENDKDAIAMLQIFEALKTVIPCSMPDLLFVIDTPPEAAMKRIMSLLKLFDRNLFTLYVRQFCSLTLSGMVPGQDF